MAVDAFVKADILEGRAPRLLGVFVVKSAVCIDDAERFSRQWLGDHINICDFADGCSNLSTSFRHQGVVGEAIKVALQLQSGPVASETMYLLLRYHRQPLRKREQTSH